MPALPRSTSPPLPLVLVAVQLRLRRVLWPRRGVATAAPRAPPARDDVGRVHLVAFGGREGQGWAMETSG